MFCSLFPSLQLFYVLSYGKISSGKNSYLYLALCKETQFVLKDLEINIKTTNRMSTTEDIHDRVYRHFKANLEVWDTFFIEPV